MLSLDDIARRAIEHTVDRMPTIDQLLEALVRIPSASADAEGNRRCLQVMAGGFGALGFRGAMVAGDGGREHLLCRRDGREGSPNVLLLGHTDTAWEPKRDFEGFWSQDGRARGPGVANMKAGLVVMLTMLDTLAELQLLDAFHFRALLTTDEEGKDTGGALAQKLAAQAQVALVFESVASPEAVITSRRAYGHFAFDVYGRASHAGAAHADGRNAILELAYKIPKIDGLTNPRRGITVNCGLVSGGTRANVVPEHARLEIDARCEGPTDATYIERRLAEIAGDVMLKGCRTTVTGGFLRGAWPRSSATEELVAVWGRAASALGLPAIRGIAAGDASHANHAHAAGAPTLDGLGPVAGGFHTEEEWADMASITRRAALSATALALWRARQAKHQSGRRYQPAEDPAAAVEIAADAPAPALESPALAEPIAAAYSEIDEDGDALVLYDVDDEL